MTFSASQAVSCTRRLPQHIVTFPGETSEYFFQDRDLASWLEEEGEQAAAPAQRTAGGKGTGAAGSSRAAPAARDLGGSRKGTASGSAAAKRNRAAGTPQARREGEGRPSKKAKPTGGSPVRWRVESLPAGRRRVLSSGLQAGRQR